MFILLSKARGNECIQSDAKDREGEQVEALYLQQASWEMWST